MIVIRNLGDFLRIFENTPNTLLLQLKESSLCANLHYDASYELFVKFYKTYASIGKIFVFIKQC